MDFSVHKKELLEELERIQGVVEKRTTIPILSHVLLEASGDRLRLSATDLELAMHTSCPAAVKKEGGGTVPARKLVDLVRLLPDEEIRFRLLDNHWVQLTAQRKTYRMVGLSRDNFPTLPSRPPVLVEIPAQILAELIARTAFAISTEESRYTLNGALLILRPQGLVMVATDGHRLALVEMDHQLVGLEGEVRALVPRKALAELRRLVDAAEDGAQVAFAQDEAHLFFELGGRILVSRKLMGQFPNFEAVLPRDNNRTVVLDRDAFAGALRRVAQLADERSRAVRLALAAEGVEISASSPDFGEAREAIETEYRGEPLVIGFNAQYLLDFLEATGTGPVSLELKDESSAGQLRPADHPGLRYRYVVMPMRL
jgi:DNA polymerase-3 subunit beta